MIITVAASLPGRRFFIAGVAGARRTFVSRVTLDDGRDDLELAFLTMLERQSKMFGPLATDDLPFYTSPSIAKMPYALDILSYITHNAGFWRDEKRTDVSSIFRLIGVARPGVFELTADGH